MKKFLTSLAVAALAFPAFADMNNYTVTPTPGDVTMLDAVNIEFPDYAELDINSRDDIQFSCKGAEYTGYVNKGYSGNVLSVSFRPAITEPGEYTITLLAGCICGFDDSYTIQDDLGQTITLTYTIPDGGVSGDGDFSYVCNPAEGTVDEISVVNVTFDKFESLDINDKSAIMAIFKGEQISCKIENKPVYSNNLRFTFDPAITEAGHLELYIPAGSICGYADEDMYGDYQTIKDLDNDISINFTIGGAVSEGPDFSFTATPAAGKVNELAEVALIFAGLTTLELEGTLNVTLDGSAIATDAFDASAEGNILKVTFTPALVGEGAVVISIPAEALKGVADDIEGKNEKEISLAYTLEAPAAPVVYDLTIAWATPKFKSESNDGVINRDDNLEMFALRSGVYGLRPAEGATAVFASEDGSYSLAMPLRFAMESNTAAFGIYTQFKAIVTERPKYDGKYTLTIAKGSFGDEAWIADPETGRSNDEIVLEYVLEGFGSPIVGPQYTLAPVSVTPQVYTTVDDLTTITLQFGERVFLTAEFQAVLSNIENRFSETATATVSGGTVTLTFANNPTEYGDYSLTIARGSLCDNDYAEDPDGGKLNDELTYFWTFNPGSAVETINAAAANAPVFNLQGVKVADSLDNLPAGLYIQAGRKVTVK